MPTYDYRCEKCGHTFDAFQRMSADVLTECPECKEHALKRLIGSGAGIIFKGSGFYETDYKRARSGSGQSDDSKTEAQSESKGEKKTETKKADTGSS